MKNTLFGYVTMMLLALLLAALIIPGAAGAQTPGDEAERSTAAPAEADSEDTFIAHSPMGFVRGQQLSITLTRLANPGAPAAARSPLRIKGRLLDQAGRVLVQSAEITVAEGETRSWTVERSTLPLPGEPGTGRMQVRFEWILPRGLPRGTVLLPALELINTDTGSTQVMDTTATFCRPEGCYQIIIETVK